MTAQRSRNFSIAGFNAVCIEWPQSQKGGQTVSVLFEPTSSPDVDTKKSIELLTRLVGNQDIRDAASSSTELSYNQLAFDRTIPTLYNENPANYNDVCDTLDKLAKALPKPLAFNQLKLALGKAKKELVAGVEFSRKESWLTV